MSAAGLTALLRVTQWNAKSQEQSLASALVTLEQTRDRHSQIEAVLADRTASITHTHAAEARFDVSAYQLRSEAFQQALDAKASHRVKLAKAQLCFDREEAALKVFRHHCEVLERVITERTRNADQVAERRVQAEADGQWLANHWSVR